MHFLSFSEVTTCCNDQPFGKGTQIGIRLQISLFWLIVVESPLKHSCALPTFLLEIVHTSNLAHTWSPVVASSRHSFGARLHREYEGFSQLVAYDSIDFCICSARSTTV